MNISQFESLIVPVQLLLGMRSDPVFGRAAERLRRLVPQTAIHWVDAAGHCLQLDAPAALAAAVARVVHASSAIAAEAVSA